MDKVTAIISAIRTWGPRALTWLNAEPGRKRGLAAALLGLGRVLQVLGYSDYAASVEGLNGALQNATTVSDLSGVAMFLWGQIHAYMRKKDEMPKPVEWVTVGTVPEVKALPKVEVVGAQTVSYEEVDVRSKEQYTVGTKVRLPDGRDGVVLINKETSAAGYTYGVRVAK